MKNVDVIITLYNDRNIINNVQSILEAGIKDIHQVYIIDDCSPDSALVDDLRQFIEPFPVIKYLRNEENIGYTKSANRGMGLSENDVILLNSDTLVSRHWTKKLSIAAYSSSRIATVTPLSNNATVFSIPCDNLLNKPNGVNRINSILAFLFTNKYLITPTCHGFCVYIRRDALDDVGNFDSQTYPIAYGEENDFSQRCMNKQYLNIIAGDTFVFHKGRQSHGEQLRSELASKNYETLIKHYPTYAQQVQDFENQSELKRIKNTMAKINKNTFFSNPVGLMMLKFYSQSIDLGVKAN